MSMEKHEITPKSKAQHQPKDKQIKLVIGIFGHINTQNFSIRTVILLPEKAISATIGTIVDNAFKNIIKD